MSENRHIIQKLTVEVSTNSKERGYAIKDDAAGFVSGRLAPELEKLFEELEKKLNGRVLNIGKLSLDLDIKASDWTRSDMERQVSEAVLKELEKELAQEESELFSEHRSVGEKKLHSVVSRRLQAVFYFLRTGEKPWWISGNLQMNELFTEESLLELANEDAGSLLNELCTSVSQSFTRRLILQLPEKVLQKWLSESFLKAFSYSGADFTEKQLIEKIFGTKSLQIPAQYREKWWAVLLKLLRELTAYGKFSIQALGELKAIVEIIPALAKEPKKKITDLIVETKGIDKENSSETGKEAFRESEEKEFIPMENAGLILLHPFLKPFLTAIGLLEKNELKNPELAAHVLHFLATGRECCPEYELSFEKFICGIPLNDPISREVNLSEEIKAEAIRMLTAATGHWKGLKSSSYELLQTEFLQREAKIITDEFQSVRLIFERKTHDILMDSLPWNLGIVKLSWMEDLIYVEW